MQIDLKQVVYGNVTYATTQRIRNIIDTYMNSTGELPSMPKERAHRKGWEMGDWEMENHLQARQAQDAGSQESQRLAVPATNGQAGRSVLPILSDIGDQPADWSDQPTQPQGQIQTHRDWPAQSSDNRPEWPLRAVATDAAASPLHRLLDAAHERQFNLGCGTLAALVLLVAALVAAFSNGWLPTNAGPRDSQPGIQASPAQSTAPIPTVTPSPSPTATPIPTDTPVPTDTPIPTESPLPTQTSIPSPTETQHPTATTPPTLGPLATPPPSQSTVAPTPPAQP